MATRRGVDLVVFCSLFCCVSAMAPFYDANEQFALGNGVEREIKHATALSKAKPPKAKPGEKPDPKLVAKDRAEIHAMHADFAKEMKADGGVHPNKDFKMMK